MSFLSHLLHKIILSWARIWIENGQPWPTTMTIRSWWTCPGWPSSKWSGDLRCKSKLDQVVKMAPCVCVMAIIAPLAIWDRLKLYQAINPSWMRIHWEMNDFDQLSRSSGYLKFNQMVIIEPFCELHILHLTDVLFKFCPSYCHRQYALPRTRTL